jgi:hypothetical protein
LVPAEGVYDVVAGGRQTRAKASGKAAEVFLGPGFYGVTTWIIFGCALFVFGTIWGLVAWDHFSSPGPESLRFLVVTVIAIVFPTGALLLSRSWNRRARARNDFDTVGFRDGVVILRHSFDGRETAIPEDLVDEWVLHSEAAPRPNASQPLSYRVRLRQRDGLVLQSEPVASFQSLQRKLKSAGIPYRDELAMRE